MTSNWKRFKGQEPPEPTYPPLLVDGTYRCQICMEDTDVAEYFQASRVLRWKCSQGHISLIEKFDL